MAESEGDPPSAMDRKIIEQIEYYFGDYNLSRDKFLQEQIKEDDGWVPLETMIKFNRLKSLTEEFCVIRAALKKSTKALMEIDDTRNKIRRSPSMPLPNDNKEYKDSVRARTVYAKGIPADVTLDQLKEYFSRYGDVGSIIMRRMHDKTFKGSVFVSFEDKEHADKFINEETSKWGDTELIKYYQQAYYDKKNKERLELKEKQKKEQQATKVEDEIKLISERMTKGCILHLSGFAAGVTREDIKAVLAPHGSVAWVDYEKGDKEAWVRFNKSKDDEHTAQTVVHKVLTDGKLIIKDSELTHRILEGDEEVKHWISVFEKQAERRVTQKQRQKGKKRGKDFGRKNRDRGPPNKKTKFESDDEAEASSGHDSDNIADAEMPTNGSKLPADNGEPPEKKIKVESPSKTAARKLPADNTEPPEKKIKVESPSKTAARSKLPADDAEPPEKKIKNESPSKTAATTEPTIEPQQKAAAATT